LRRSLTYQFEHTLIVDLAIQNFNLKSYFKWLFSSIREICSGNKQLSHATSEQ
jgi:hypothetical protein